MSSVYNRNCLVSKRQMFYVIFIMVIVETTLTKRTLGNIGTCQIFAKHNVSLELVLSGRHMATPCPCMKQQLVNDASFFRVGHYYEHNCFTESDKHICCYNNLKSSESKDPSSEQILKTLSFLNSEEKFCKSAYNINNCTNYVPSYTERCHMYANEKRLQDIVEIANRLSTPCACSEQQIALDMSFKMVGRCYEQYFFANGVKQKCCYNDLGMLSTGAPNGGYILLETLPFSMDTFHDVCCQNNADEHCKKFYYISPSNNCSGYNPEIPVTSWGDPIIATLDNHSYSFNGRGEYVFLRTENRSLEIQARTDYLKDGNVDATIFVAFVIKDNLMNESVTVILNRNNNTMSLFLTNGTLWKTAQCIDDKFQTRAFLIICHNNKGVTVLIRTRKFPISTVDFKVKEFLSVSFDKGSAKSSLTTEGLAGKTKNETFCGRNGTHYPINSTESSMYLFGESWRLQNESESYFNYSLIHGGSFVSYHGNHTPPRFFVELVGNLTELFSGYTPENITNFNKTCVRYWDNTVNEECLLTIARTGDVDQGKNIMVEVNATRMAYEKMHNSPPKFNSTPEHIVVVYRQNLTWIFNMSSYVMDDGNINDLTFNVSTNLKKFSLHDGVFNWTIGTELRSISLELKFIVTDRFAASDVFSPKVLYCGCEQPSQCSFSGLDLMPGETFLRASCQCPLSRKSLFCELAANRCSDVHCYKNLTCNDTSDQENPCESCTTGFVNQFNKTHQFCEDIDECSESITRYCEQDCANTIGSYKCSCKQGYQTSTDSNHCDDIDECKQGLHKCSETPYTMCVNSIGSHRCVCQPMYRSVNGSCNKIEGFSYVGVVNITVSSETPIGKAYNRSTINAVENRIDFQENLIGILQEVPGFLSIEVLSLQAITNTPTGLDATFDLNAEYIVHFDKNIEQGTLRKIMDQTLWNKTHFVVLKNGARHQSHTLDIYKFLERGLCNITGRTDCMNSTTECTNIQGGYKCKCLPGYVEIPNNSSSCKDCGELPTNIDHVVLFDIGKRTVGATANVTCIDGYNASSITIACQENGTWSTVNCLLIDCGPLPNVQYGHAKGNGTTVGMIANVSCNEGYNTSSTTTICQGNGTWSSVECVINDCGPLPEIRQGQTFLNGTTTVGAFATVHCNEGYSANIPVMTCQSNGTWSSVNCLLKDCGPPTNLTYGSVSIPNGTLVGAIATYRCISGYTLSGNHTRNCINGEWSHSEPSCKQDCHEPGNITYGFVSTPSGTLDEAAAIYHCTSGYRLSGNVTRICFNGSWSGVEPTCILGCSPLPNVDHGALSAQGTADGVSVIYSCSPGYKLIGQSTRTCVNGTWRGTDPKCLKDTPTICLTWIPATQFYSSDPFDKQARDCIQVDGIFTGGNNVHFPGCCSGLCCKLFSSSWIATNGTGSMDGYSAYVQHLLEDIAHSTYSSVEQTCITWSNAWTSDTRTPFDQQARECTEARAVFTGGNNVRFPGCCSGWCCKPSSSTWFASKATSWRNGQIPPKFDSFDKQARECTEFGGVYTGGNNAHFPGCSNGLCCIPA